MLISCPECELQISDKAITCPHCGYPIQPNRIPTVQRPKKPNGRRRLPNGFGQITELKDPRLRNRFRVMVTVGYSSNGKQIQKLLKPKSYFRTYKDAYEALLEYNQNPYDLHKDFTVKELYDIWSKEYFDKLKNDSSKRTIKSSWSRCSSVERMRVKDIRARHIKGCMDEAPSPGMKSRIKSMFNIMLDYALEYELVDKNYARTFNVSDDIKEETEKTKKSHIAFSNDEMNTLWHNIDIPYVDIILIQSYSGLRPQEIGLVKIENVYLDKGYMIGGMKTKAGVNRIIPIHDKIKDLVVAKYNEAISLGSKYIFNCTDSNKGLKLTYDKYEYRFMKVIELLDLNPDHRPHDPRKTFTTMAKKYKVDEYAIKYIVGHSITDITEKVYTERNTEWLIEEMSKIK